MEESETDAAEVTTTGLSSLNEAASGTGSGDHNTGKSETGRPSGAWELMAELIGDLGRTPTQSANDEAEAASGVKTDADRRRMASRTNVASSYTRESPQGLAASVEGAALSLDIDTADVPSDGLSVQKDADSAVGVTRKYSENEGGVGSDNALEADHTGDEQPAEPTEESRVEMSQAVEGGRAEIERSTELSPSATDEAMVDPANAPIASPMTSASTTSVALSPTVPSTESTQSGAASPELTVSITPTLSHGQKEGGETEELTREEQDDEDLFELASRTEATNSTSTTADIESGEPGHGSTVPNYTGVQESTDADDPLTVPSSDTAQPATNAEADSTAEVDDATQTQASEESHNPPPSLEDKVAEPTDTSGDSIGNERSATQDQTASKTDEGQLTAQEQTPSKTDEGQSTTQEQPPSKTDEGDVVREDLADDEVEEEEEEEIIEIDEALVIPKTDAAQSQADAELAGEVTGDSVVASSSRDTETTVTHSPTPKSENGEDEGPQERTAAPKPAASEKASGRTWSNRLTKRAKQYNYASYDCNAKVLDSNKGSQRCVCVRWHLDSSSGCA
jgi:hypothetical protein